MSVGIPAIVWSDGTNYFLETTLSSANWTAAQYLTGTQYITAANTLLNLGQKAVYNGTVSTALTLNSASTNNFIPQILVNGSTQTVYLLPNGQVAGSPSILNAYGTTYAGYVVGVGGISTNGTIWTVTTGTTHNFLTGQTVYLGGLSPTGYNGSFTIASTGATNTFTISNTAQPGAVTFQGTATVQPFPLPAGGAVSYQGINGSTGAVWLTGSNPQTLSGDVTVGNTGAATVNKVQGVAISGTPSAGQVLTASATNAASWSAQSSVTVLSTTGGTGTAGATGTYTVPSWATNLRVICVGGGGGGAGGGYYAGTTGFASGGQGGNGGNATIIDIPVTASLIASGIPYGIGGGGTGGTCASSTTTYGATGGTGATTYFGSTNSVTNAYCYSSGGLGGVNGGKFNTSNLSYNNQFTAGSTQSSGTVLYGGIGGYGGTGATAGVPGTNAAIGTLGGFTGGGGGGGGCSYNLGNSNGGAGGKPDISPGMSTVGAGGVVSGSAATSGSTFGYASPGAGGGNGNNTPTPAGANGVYGGGGGGGGAAANTTTGVGGNGGAGYIVVIAT